jgi:hypothetical protein
MNPTFEAASDAGEWAPPLLRRRSWIAIGLALKVVMAVYFVSQNPADPLRDRWGMYREGVDAESFLRPAENLLTSGEYIQDRSEPATAVRRLPGYGLTYLLFRAPTSPETGRRLLAAFQVALGGLSVYVLAAAAGRAFRSRTSFLVTFAVFGAQSFTSVWDTVLMTESLAASVAVGMVALLVSYLGRGRPHQAFLIGALFVALYNLRPVTAPLGVLLVVFVWCAARRHGDVAGSRRRQVVAAILVSAAPLMFEGAWIARNFGRFGRLVPLEINYLAGVDFTLGPDNPSYPTIKDVQLHALRWVNAVGGDLIWYRPGTLGAWLHANAPFSDETRHPEPRILTPDYDAAAVTNARNQFVRFLSMDRAERASDEGRRLGLAVIGSFDAFTESYRRTRPLAYWFGNRARMVAHLVAHSGTLYLPLPAGAELLHDPVALAVKLLGGLTYWVVVVFGTVGTLLALRRRSLELALFAALPAYTVIVLPMVGILEPRFLVPAFPPLVVLAGEALRGGAEWAGRSATARS